MINTIEIEELGQFIINELGNDNNKKQTSESSSGSNFVEGEIVKGE